MKSLSTSRPLVLLIVGVPGAGKSHFARQFASIFHTPRVSYDKIQSILFTEPSFSKEEELLIANIMNSQIQELYKTQKTFLVDGAVNSRAARMEIERTARKHDYGTLTIWIQTDHESSQYRVTSRNKRRDGDKYNVRMTEEQFKKHAQRINPPALREQFAVISGKHTFATQAKVVLKKIVAPRDMSVVPIQRDTAASEQKPTERARIISS